MPVISHVFDAGNVEVVSADKATDIQLTIRPDQNADFYQWFYYRVSNVRDTELSMTIQNAAGAAYADGWDGYQAMASYDQLSWFRVHTEYLDGELVIRHTPQYDSVYYAYFTPYSLERHQQLVAQLQTEARCLVRAVGQSIQGRPIDLLQIGEVAQNKHKVWIIGRQHPGETMAEWFIEGLLLRLLDNDDALSEALLSQCTFYVVPNMNPDGSTLGHLRTNAAGVNLNRVWGKADTQQSPEVFYVQKAIQETGCDLFFDIHGDETLPWNFIAGQAGLPVEPHILEQETRFKARLADMNPDFQTEHGYPPKKFGEESLSLASNWVGKHFNIAAMTLEMPFKDNAARPDPVAGWSAERSMQLGASLLYPISKHFEGP